MFKSSVIAHSRSTVSVVCSVSNRLFSSASLLSVVRKPFFIQWNKIKNKKSIHRSIGNGLIVIDCYHWCCQGWWTWRHRGWGKRPERSRLQRPMWTRCKWHSSTASSCNNSCAYGDDPVVDGFLLHLASAGGRVATDQHCPSAAGYWPKVPVAGTCQSSQNPYSSLSLSPGVDTAAAAARATWCDLIAVNLSRSITAQTCSSPSFLSYSILYQRKKARKKEE